MPDGDDQDVYLVIDDLGRLGRVGREAYAEATDLKTILTNCAADAIYKCAIFPRAFKTLSSVTKAPAGN